MNLTLCHLSWECVVLTGWLSTLVAVTSVLCFYFWLKYSKQPMLKNKHEEDMKENAFKREKEWYFIKETVKPLKKELEKAKEELETLQKKEEELNEGRQSLNNEKNEFEKNVLKTKIKVYEEIIKTINK